jgi:hypothetical protein
VNFAYGISTIGAEGVRALYQQHNVRWFTRYSPEILQNAYTTLREGRTGTRPVLFIGFADSDHNGAFTSSGHELSPLNNTYRIALFELPNQDALADSLNQTAIQYGQIQTAVIGGHGTSQSIQLGNPSSQPNNAILDRNDETSIRIRLSPHIFSPNAICILDSCSTGSVSCGPSGTCFAPVAQTLKDLLGIPVIAPETPESGVHYILNNEGIVAGATYTGAEAQIFLPGVSGGRRLLSQTVPRRGR